MNTSIEGGGTPITKEQMELVDKLYDNPDERATKLYNELLDMYEETDKEVPQVLDFLCFAISYIGQQALAMQDDIFLELAVNLNRWLWAAHYSNPGRLYGEPTLKEEGTESE